MSGTPNHFPMDALLKAFGLSQKAYTNGVCISYLKIGIVYGCEKVGNELQRNSEKQSKCSKS